MILSIFVWTVFAIVWLLVLVLVTIAMVFVGAGETLGWFAIITVAGIIIVVLAALFDGIDSIRTFLGRKIVESRTKNDLEEEEERYES